MINNGPIQPSNRLPGIRGASHSRNGGGRIGLFGWTTGSIPVATTRPIVRAKARQRRQWCDRSAVSFEREVASHAGHARARRHADRRPDDASPRLRAELGAADVVAAEDTRRLRRLAADLGVTLAGPVVSYYEANEAARSAELVDALLAGARRAARHRRRDAVGVSDPGYRLVAAAVDGGRAGHRACPARRR